MLYPTLHTRDFILRVLTSGLCFVSVCIGHADAQTVGERIHSVLAEEHFVPGKLDARGRRLLESSSPDLCDSLFLGEGLVLQAAVLRKVAVILDTVNCKDAPEVLVYLRAANAHLGGRLEEALEGFLRTSGSGSERLAVNSLNAAGSVYMDLAEYELAIRAFEAAHLKCTELRDAPTTLMNLSAACLLSGDYTNAVKWTYLAEDAMEQLETSADKSLVEPHWGMSILVNRLNAQMHLGMEEAARETAERLDFHVELLLRYADLLEVVVAYAVSRDDLSFFQAHMPELSKLAQIDSAETVRRLRGHATLFSPWREAVWGKMPVDSVWNAVRGIPNRLGTQLLGSIEQVRMEATHEPVPKPSGANFPVSAAATFAVLSVLLVLGAGIRTLPEIVLGWRWNVLEKMPDEQLIEVVAHAQLASGSGIQEKLAKYAVVEVMRRRYQEESLHTVPGFSTLTDREREFVHHLVQGKRAKEFAQGKSLSTGYIYNLSSHIRQKLQVPENQEIATWISRQRQGVR